MARDHLSYAGKIEIDIEAAPTTFRLYVTMAGLHVCTIKLDRLDLGPDGVEAACVMRPAKPPAMPRAVSGYEGLG